MSDCATPWTAAHQAAVSLGFSRQEYWSGLPFHSLLHTCMLSCFSHVWLCAAPWIAAYQAPPVLQARMLEWVAISFSKFIWVSSKHHYLSPFRRDNWVWWPCTLILHLTLSSNFLLLLHLFISLEIEKQFPQQVLEYPPESRRNSQFVNNEVWRGVWLWDGFSEPSPSLQNCEK